MRPFRTPIARLCLLVPLALAACGGDEDTASATPAIVVESLDGTTSTEVETTGETSVTDSTAEAASTADDTTDEEKAIAFVDCMRDEGIDLPDPTVNADGSLELGGPGAGGGRGDGQGAGREEGFGEAFEQCGDLLEGASFLGDRRGGIDDAEFEDTMLEFAQCLRDQGLDVDDPDLDNIGPGAGGGGGLFGPEFDPQDPANADAIDACQDVLAGLPFGGRRNGGDA